MKVAALLTPLLATAVQAILPPPNDGLANFPHPIYTPNHPHNANDTQSNHTIHWYRHHHYCRYKPVEPKDNHTRLGFRMIVSVPRRTNLTLAKIDFVSKMEKICPGKLEMKSALFLAPLVAATVHASGTPSASGFTFIPHPTTTPNDAISAAPDATAWYDNRLFRCRVHPYHPHNGSFWNATFLFNLRVAVPRQANLTEAKDNFKSKLEEICPGEIKNIIGTGDIHVIGRDVGKVPVSRLVLTGSKADNSTTCLNSAIKDFGIVKRKCEVTLR
ncbi:hypothetical protein BDZ85DRAFT_319605 [Elsinoe ampelina]|uniref:Uncharacterized protein n=1 Tax=Elsinoe ampelina TaxID=302913 RepID=A0A6A6G9B6_9PEZI|nr:hypothetical protein BDZ85DRAFT_319605 [Elsinoe ampelina]